MTLNTNAWLCGHPKNLNDLIVPKKTTKIPQKNVIIYFCITLIFGIILHDFHLNRCHTQTLNLKPPTHSKTIIKIIVKITQ